MVNRLAAKFIAILFNGVGKLTAPSAVS